ncbi:hypothetical protein DVH24_007109 [Malus domestica]|uniref:Wall-associated receptor kinase C-terminal domain-containing protein n=1 Tax=Malus domestica TaxID=3750 RepID=A0A498HLP3_MALDO|nr:hypothetical protein DVH24_007109 [Malus domestica]
MDLEKLQCSSYSGFYSFNERESDPNSWKYGIALKYKFSVNNEYPSSCANCERSNGVCGDWVNLLLGLVIAFGIVDCEIS